MMVKMLVFHYFIYFQDNIIYAIHYTCQIHQLALLEVWSKILPEMALASAAVKLGSFVKEVAIC
jgi:hypothetical protein